MKREGFTFVTILVAIAILCTLMAISLPSFIRMRHDAILGKTQAELSSLYKSFVMFNLATNRYPQELGELNDYITIPNIDDKYDLNPNLP